MGRKITQNEKAANQILDALNDYTIDPQLIGLHIVHIAPMDLYGKLEEVMEGVDLGITIEEERVQKEYERRKEKPPF